MPNMSYCKFQNTLRDLRDCSQSFGDVHSIEEAKAQLALFELCGRIADSHSEEELREQLKDLQEEDAALEASDR